MSDQHPYYKFSKHLDKISGDGTYTSYNKISKNEKIERPEIKLDYKLNQYGFRSQDWTDNKEECYLVLGSSNTFGTGTPEEDRWSNLIQDHTGITVYNLGINGGACDSVTRLLLGWVDIIKPSKVFVLWPPVKRWEVGKKDHVRCYTPSMVYSMFENKAHSDAGYCIDYLGQDFNSDINKTRNAYALRGICNERNIEYYTLETHGFKHIDMYKARDGKHNGSLMQKAIAEEFIKLLDK